MWKLVYILPVILFVLITVQTGIVKRDDRWSCEWDCSSYAQQHTFDPMQNVLSLFGIGRKKRVVYSSYRYDCDCNTFGW